MKIDKSRKAVRQGDVLVVPVTEARHGQTVATDKLMLAEGEATGHSHMIECHRAVMFRADDGVSHVIDLPKPALLEHQEHGALTIGKGSSLVVLQRVARAGVARRVTD